MSNSESDSEEIVTNNLSRVFGNNFDKKLLKLRARMRDDDPSKLITDEMDDLEDDYTPQPYTHTTPKDLDQLSKEKLLGLGNNWDKINKMYPTEVGENTNTRKLTQPTRLNPSSTKHESRRLDVVSMLSPMGIPDLPTKAIPPEVQFNKVLKKLVKIVNDVSNDIDLPQTEVSNRDHLIAMLVRIIAENSINLRLMSKNVQLIKALIRGTRYTNVLHSALTNIAMCEILQKETFELVQSAELILSGQLVLKPNFKNFLHTRGQRICLHGKGAQANEVVNKFNFLAPKKTKKNNPPQKQVMNSKKRRTMKWIENKKRQRLLKKRKGPFIKAKPPTVKPIIPPLNVPKNVKRPQQ